MCTWTVAGPLGTRLGFCLTLFIGPQIHKTPTTALNGQEAQKKRKKNVSRRCLASFKKQSNSLPKQFNSSDLSLQRLSSGVGPSYSAAVQICSHTVGFFPAVAVCCWRYVGRLIRGFLRFGLLLALVSWTTKNDKTTIAPRKANTGMVWPTSWL